MRLEAGVRIGRRLAFSLAHPAQLQLPRSQAHRVTGFVTARRIAISGPFVKSPITRSKLVYEPAITRLNPRCWHFCWHFCWHTNDGISHVILRETALARAGGWLRSVRSAIPPHAPRQFQFMGRSVPLPVARRRRLCARSARRSVQPHRPHEHFCLGPSLSAPARNRHSLESILTGTR